QKSDGNFTRSLLLSTVPVITINGTAYREFLLDVNEPLSAGKQLVTFDQMQLFQSTTGSVFGYAQNPANLGALVYNLDSGGDNTVLIDANLENGSGKSGVFIDVPDALFNDASRPYVVLYAAFGGGALAQGGFEEFTVRGQSAAAPIPLPRAASSGLLTLGLIAL